MLMGYLCDYPDCDIMKAYMPKPCRSPYCECEVGKCTHPGFYDARGEPMPTHAELMALWNVCKTFIEEQHVSCEEVCCEDRVYEEAPNLVADIGNIVGYYEYPEDE